MKKKPGKYDDGKKMTTTVTTNEDERIERIAIVAENTGKRNIYMKDIAKSSKRNALSQTNRDSSIDIVS